MIRQPLSPPDDPVVYCVTVSSVLGPLALIMLGRACSTDLLHARPAVTVRVIASGTDLVELTERISREPDTVIESVRALDVVDVGHCPDEIGSE